MVFNEYVHTLMTTASFDYSDGVVEAAVFVRNPAGLYPHGSVGVVDLTLTINGVEAWMGTAFDSFIDASHATGSMSTSRST